MPVLSEDKTVKALMSCDVRAREASANLAFTLMESGIYR